MKTKEEIIHITEATVAAYSNSPVWYKKDIEKYMEEYSQEQNKELLNKLSLADKIIKLYELKENLNNLVKE